MSIRTDTKICYSVISGKILITGKQAAGKTSIVKQFVHGKFDNEYFHSVGERIDSVKLKINNRIKEG